jgi:hypothetical protein
MRLPAHRLRRIGAALEPGLRVDRLRHEHHRVVGRVFGERGPLALFLRRTGEGEFDGDDLGRVRAAEVLVPVAALAAQAEPLALAPRRSRAENRQQREPPRPQPAPGAPRSCSVGEVDEDDIDDVEQHDQHQRREVDRPVSGSSAGSAAAAARAAR